MTSKDRPERDFDAGHMQGYAPGERPARDTDDWLSTIGPEDMSREEVIENLEEYGLDLLYNEDELSLESVEEYPSWAGNGAYRKDPDVVGDELGATLLDADDNTALRPVEDIVLNELAGDVDDEA